MELDDNQVSNTAQPQKMKYAMKCGSLLFLIVLALMPARAAAQSGQISGRVTDAVTGAPLPNARVAVLGTVLEGTTDEDGRYVLAGVVPGHYDVEASRADYGPVFEEVLVRSGETASVSFGMRRWVQPRVTHWRVTLFRGDLRNGRYPALNAALAAQPGAEAVRAYEDRFGLRGSGFEGVSFLVDGVRHENLLSNRPYVHVNPDAVEAVTLQTSGFGAEHGDLRSGLIQVTTREGGDRYEGTLNLQYSPPALKHFGPMMYGFDSPVVRPFIDPAAGAFTGIDEDGNRNRFFVGWNAYAEEGGPHAGQPEELYARWLWRHRSQDAINELKRLEQEGVVAFAEGVDPDDMAFHQYGLRPDYRASATLGGPVPLLRSTRFFGSYYADRTEHAYRLAEPDYRDHHLYGKLDARLTQRLGLTLHGTYATQAGARSHVGLGGAEEVSSNPFRLVGDANKLWYPHVAGAGRQMYQVYGARLKHTRSPRTSYTVALSHHRTDYAVTPDVRDTAPLLQGSGMASSYNRSGVEAGAIGTEAEADARAAAGEPGWERWRDWARIRIGEVWYDEAPKGYGPTFWTDALGYYRMEGGYPDTNDTASRTLRLAAGLATRAGRHVKLEGGFEVRRIRFLHYASAFDLTVGGGTYSVARATPWQGATYAQGQFAFGNATADLGFRLDGMRHGAFPVLDGEAGDPNGPYSPYLLPGNTDALWQEVPLKRVHHLRISPRLGVAYAFGQAAKVFANYGHFYRWPSLDALYRIGYDTRQGGRVVHHGNPRLLPPRTVAYEVGYQHSLLSRLSLALTAYSRNHDDELGLVRYFPISLGGTSYSAFANRGSRSVRGLETSLALERRAIPFVSGWGSFSYQTEQGRYAGPDRFFEDQRRQPSEAAPRSFTSDVRPLIKLNLDLHTPDALGPSLGRFPILGGLGANLLYTWKRGAPFTWNPAQHPLVADNVRWRPYRRWDLRFTKRLFTSGSRTAALYLDVVNLLNTRNMTPYPPHDQGLAGVAGHAWEGHRWWTNALTDYMYSLGYSAEKQRPDGSFDTDKRPGDGEGDGIDLPEFAPWMFLEKRDVYVGLRLTF